MSHYALRGSAGLPHAVIVSDYLAHLGGVGSCQTCGFCSYYWNSSSISPISKTGLYSPMAEGAKYFCKSPAYQHWRKWDRCGIVCPCDFSNLSSFSFASHLPFFPQLLATLSYRHFIPSTLYFVPGIILRALLY